MPSTTTASKLKKILIVEDEADICLLLNIILKDDKVEVEHVKSLAKAKDYLANDVPDVVLLDHKLPDGLGLDFIEFIKLNYPSIKIIMLTGYTPATPREIALSDHADIFLEKPFTREQVYASVQKLLN